MTLKKIGDKGMEVKVVLANEENANIIKNIYPLYLQIAKGDIYWVKSV